MNSTAYSAFGALKRPLVEITRESGIPLVGCIAFGLIDRGTNLIQVRPVSGCVFCCVFCSIDEGPCSRTRYARYVVEREYLVESFKLLAKFKGGEALEAHIDCAGEPTLYKELPELVHDLSQVPGVEVISMQTHGGLLTEKLVDRLEAAGMSRINLSIDAVNAELAKYLSGRPDYDVERMLGLAEYIANSKIDLLLAPVWVPGLNDDEVPKIVEFAKKIGAGKRWPPLGIQKFEAHKYGRRPRGVRPMTWREFYERLRGLERRFGVKLVIRPEDFGIRKMRKLPCPVKRGEVVKVRVVGPGWMVGEKLAVARGRAITVVRANRSPVGAELKVRVLSNKDNIVVAAPLP